MKDLGDFQTPPALVAAVLDELGPIGTRWARVLEPTCGRGHFLKGVLDRAGAHCEAIGIEIQDAHVHAARSAIGGAGNVIHGSLFDLDLRRDLSWRGEGPLLVVGNPPWVTNAQLGCLGSDNLPRKRNIKGLPGVEARTGSSNFDIAEAIWLKLIEELAGERPTIALLCKTAVARAVLAHATAWALPVAEASIHRIDAAKWFRAATDACLLRVSLGTTTASARVPVHAALGAPAPESWLTFGTRGVVADADLYASCAFADGTCPLVWRQGIKHDAVAVMELTWDGVAQSYRNGLGELVEVEPEFVYPLVKGRDLGSDARIPAGRLSVAAPAGAPPSLTLPHKGGGDILIPPPPSWGRAGVGGAAMLHQRGEIITSRRTADSEPVAARAVIVTQTRLGDDPARLEHEAPRLWRYLQQHAARFEQRKSSIYRGRPPFSLFGIGPYSFAPYKVAISGLHKTPRFRLFGPERGRPRLCDDTCYFLPFESAPAAALAHALLHEPPAQDLIRALLFRDAKRPVTKKLLQRIDLVAILARAERNALLARANEALADLSDASASPLERPDRLDPLLVDLPALFAT